MSRDERASIAQDTLRILDAGTYVSPVGNIVALADLVAAAKAGTCLYDPDVVPRARPAPSRGTVVSVTAETTCEAIARLAREGHRHLGALNFASARNPGGGFLGGAQAQEEAITRSSALYPCLLTQPAYYERNRAGRSLLYLDLAIYSPGVPFFRDDAGRLLDSPALCSVITAPAPNAGAVRDNQPEDIPAIQPTLRRRAELVLAIAAAEKIDRLILGAWGCGVFRNDPVAVAATFRDLLCGGPFEGVFTEVVFAIHDRTPGQETLRAFRDQFDSPPQSACESRAHVSSSLTRAARIRGAIYGALVGDALGVPVEFSSREELSRTPVRGMRAGGTWRQLAGTWSDDGALLLCTLEGLARHASPAEIGQLYVAWMREGRWTARGNVFDIGRTTQLALSRLADGIPPPPPAVSENGNGSLMRILPVGLQQGAADPAAQIRTAMDLSALTHGHPRSQLACVFYSLVVAHVLRGSAALDAHRIAASECAQLFAPHPAEHAVFARVLSADFRRTSERDIHSSGYVLHTLEASLWCVLNQPNFTSAVLTAVNLGGDTDTTGCVTGGLAGALHGIDAIPPEWIAALPRREEIDALLARFIGAHSTH